MRITYVSACLDSSGYAEAARNNIVALHNADVDIDVVPISFEKDKADLGRMGLLVKTMINPDKRNDIRIIHATPPNFPHLLVSGKYNIGYVAWETSLLPEGWPELINRLNEVWVPSDHNVEVFRNSGVTIPIVKVPHTFDVENEPDGPNVIQGLPEGCFIFYSVFQWLERKNPAGLLKAYLSEFRDDENVALVLKTFRLYPGEEKDSDLIRKAIHELKIRTYFKKFPRLLLISSLLSREQMAGLHKQGDCYVSLNRCEGFGIPLVEAMLAKKPVIATDYGGSKDFLLPSTGYPVKCQETPVWGMPWPMYSSKMVWGEPDLMEARKLMRYVFEHREEAAQMGKHGCGFIHENFNWKSIGTLMKNRLEQITKERQ